MAKFNNNKRYIKPEIDEFNIALINPMLAFSDARIEIGGVASRDFDADAKSRGVVTMSHGNDDFSDDDDALW